MKKNKATTTNLIIFIAILVFINLISISVFTRIDLSKGHIYSLSKASKNVVRNLDDRLVIKAYYSKNLPGELADARRFTKDILSEYQVYSHGKLRFEFIDPSNEEKLKQEANKNHIQPYTIRVLKNDQYVVREIYMGLAFLYKDKTETIPIVQNTQGLEYDITSTIKKIASQGMNKVALFESKEAASPMNPNQKDKFTTVRQLISENYELSTTDLFTKVDTTIAALIFTGVDDSLAEEQLYNLDQYLMNGGNILFFQDKVNADLQNQKAESIKSNLFTLLLSYGINIKNNLVADAECGAVQVQRQQGFFRINTPVNYPFFPIIHNINKKNLIVKNLDQMQMIFASEIDTTKSKSGISFEPLFFSSDHSGEVKAPRFDISIMKYMNKNLKTMFREKPKVLAGIYSGEFPSYFRNNPRFPDAVKKSPKVKILVITDSDFLQDNAGAGIKGNMDFVLNALDYMASDASLISIRSRETEYRPLKAISPASKKIVRWFNILFPSILLIIIGILLYKNDLKKRKMIGELYE